MRDPELRLDGRDAGQGAAPRPARAPRCRSPTAAGSASRRSPAPSPARSAPATRSCGPCCATAWRSREETVEMSLSPSAHRDRDRGALRRDRPDGRGPPRQLRGLVRAGPHRASAPSPAIHYADIEKMGYLLMVTGVEVALPPAGPLRRHGRGSSAGSSAWAAAACASPTRSASGERAAGHRRHRAHLGRGARPAGPAACPSRCASRSGGWPASQCAWSPSGRRRERAAFTRHFDKPGAGTACYSRRESRPARETSGGLPRLKRP